MGVRVGHSPNMMRKGCIYLREGYSGKSMVQLMKMADKVKSVPVI
jgi:hypothetical protein